ncbi:MAG: hypothetical protein Q9174_006121 [Haloplaca sp. 1 TL-2023]
MKAGSWHFSQPEVHRDLGAVSPYVVTQRTCNCSHKESKFQIPLLYNHPASDESTTSYTIFDTYQNLILYRLDVSQLSRLVETGLERIQALEDPEVVRVLRRARGVRGEVNWSPGAAGVLPSGSTATTGGVPVGTGVRDFAYVAPGDKAVANTATSSSDNTNVAPSGAPPTEAGNPSSPQSKDYASSLSELYAHTWMVKAKIQQTMQSLSSFTQKAAQKKEEVLANGYTKREFDQQWFENLWAEEEEEEKGGDEEVEVSGHGEWGADGTGDPNVWVGESKEERKKMEERERLEEMEMVRAMGPR